jgi:hypothetical protein
MQSLISDWWHFVGRGEREQEEEDIKVFSINKRTEQHSESKKA